MSATLPLYACLFSRHSILHGCVGVIHRLGGAWSWIYIELTYWLYVRCLQLPDEQIVI
jgi:hypothetical protein